MAHAVFVSYSSKDSSAADAICRALEDAGTSCWVAPRDIAPGADWSDSIEPAIQASKAFLLIFSEHSNESQQVKREVERAVSYGLPIIPVRITDTLPSAGMRLFLGVSHWFNAYPEPISSYLPQIVEATQTTLVSREERVQVFSHWLLRARLPRYLMLSGGVLAVAALTAFFMRPGPSGPDDMKSPFLGRWQAELKDAQGKSTTCILDVQKNVSEGSYQFSDDCPRPIGGTRGLVSATEGGANAPSAFVASRDDGTYLIQSMSGNGQANLSGSYSRSWWSGLSTHDPVLGDVNWKKIDGGTPLTNAADDVLPAKADWPIGGMPEHAARAIDYVRKRWQPDAILMEIDLRLEPNGTGLAEPLQTPAGPVWIMFQFYSPSQRESATFAPRTPMETLSERGSDGENPAVAIPPQFLDLPQAVAAAQRAGLHAKHINEATLTWSSGPACGSFKRTNALLPPCDKNQRFTGIQWRLGSEVDAPIYVPAASSPGMVQ